MCQGFARVEEAECRLVARELHDVMGQSSTLLKLLLHRAARAPDETAALLKEAGTIVDEIVSWSRNFMLDFQIQILRERGLLPALLAHFQRYTARTHVRVNFEHADVPDRLPYEKSIAVYRIIQESLADAARYAGIAEVNVQLRAVGDSLCLQVCSHGKGECPAVDEGRSGLTGIVERVQLLGGDLRLDTPEHSGTCMVVRLPLACS